MGELGETMRDAATISLLILFSTLAVVSSRDDFPWSLLLQRQRSSRQRQGGRNDVGNDDNDDGEEMNIKMLRMSVPGEPGVDYPILATVPTTSFSCVGKAEGGYYADVETGCQVVNKYSFIKYSTLCSNGTIYSQEIGTCHWWYLVDCESSEKYYFNQNNIRVDSSQTSSSSSSSSFSSSVQGQSGSQNQGQNQNQNQVQNQAGQSTQGQGQGGGGGGSSSSNQQSFNSQSSVGGQSFSLVPVGALPPIRFPGASQNEINSNVINSGTTEIAFYSSDDFNFDYLADYVDEQTQQLTTSSTRRPRRPTPGFFEPREPPKQLSYLNGKIMVED